MNFKEAIWRDGNIVKLSQISLYQISAQLSTNYLLLDKLLYLSELHIFWF